MRSLAAQLVRQLPTAVSLRTDGDLLAGFLNHGAEDEFAELVRRHGPLVWGVCRRALPDTADAEDAFQATFLVLLRRGRKLTAYPTIGPWLHKVAAWTARNVRRRNARRLARQSALPDQIPSRNFDADLPLDIDAALLALPEKFRSPIVLCHLLGYSRADAAERLGCPEGTLSAWLSRGLARLRAQFGGLDPAKPLTVAAVAVPGVLTSSVVRAAVASRVAAATTTVVSSTVSQVVEGVIRMFWIKKASAASMAACVVFALGVGVGLSGRVVEGVAEGQEKLVGAWKVAIPDSLPPDQAQELADIEHKLVTARVHHKLLLDLANLTANYVDFLRKSGAIPEQLKEALNRLARSQKDADRAADEVKALKDMLEKLKAAKQQKPLPKPNEPKTELERVEDLKLRWEAEAKRIKIDTELAAKRFKQLAEEGKAIDAIVVRLLEERNNLVGNKPAAAAKTTGYLELYVRGTAGQEEFGLREIDAADMEVVSLVVKDATVNGAMLAKVLARTRADSTAPTEVRLLVDSRASLGWGPLAILKACDAAGYKTVKFTGYVPAGGFTRQLKPDEKGEVPGYKRYDGAERKVTELIKEIDDGMRTY